MIHNRFALTCDIKAPPERVFSCWARTSTKKRWFVETDSAGCDVLEHSLDFRAGGQEHAKWLIATDGNAAAHQHENIATYLDIVPGARIVFSYTMAIDDRVHSASLASVTMSETESGTSLQFTEQGTYLDGSDGAEMRKAGWYLLLSNLADLAEADA